MATLSPSNAISMALRVSLLVQFAKHLENISLQPALVKGCMEAGRRSTSAKHFTSWLCLAPSNKISGGKVLSSRTRRSGSRAAACSDNCRADRDGARRLLSAPVHACWLRPKRSPRPPVKSPSCSTTPYAMARTPAIPARPHRRRVLSNLQRRAKALGYGRDNPGRIFTEGVPSSRGTQRVTKPRARPPGTRQEHAPPT
jgi:transposase IS116/IS110/IS902 family protein